MTYHCYATSALFLIKIQRPLCAPDVSSLDNEVVCAKFALWVRVCVDQVLEVAGPNCHSGGTILRATSRRDGVKHDFILTPFIPVF